MGSFAFYTALPELFGQIDHYWSNNFNTSSALLGGAVVGGDPDASSIFYNPALISQADESNLALTASLFKFEMLRYNNALGEGFECEERDQFKVIPRFVSYTASGGENIDLEFAFFTRNQMRFPSSRTTLRPSTSFIFRMEMNSTTVRSNTRRKYSDQWFSFGMSQHLSEKFSLGLGTFIPLKNYRSESELQVRAFPMTDSVTYDGIQGDYYIASTTDRSFLKAWDLRLVWKLGMHYQAGDLGIGLAITTPSIHLFGDGSVKREISRSNIYNPEDSEPVVDVIIVDHQDKVKADLKDPFSIAIGLHYAPEKSRSAIMMTAEYFAALDEHTVLETTGGNEQTTEFILEFFGGSPFLNVQRETQSVFNVAVGYRNKVSEKVSLIGGVRSDFTSMDKQVLGGRVTRWFNLIPYDIYHVTLGADLQTYHDWHS